MGIKDMKRVILLAEVLSCRRKKGLSCEAGIRQGTGRWDETGRVRKSYHGGVPDTANGNFMWCGIKGGTMCPRLWKLEVAGKPGEVSLES